MRQSLSSFFLYPDWADERVRSSEFFGTLMVDASAYAAHAGRKSLIHESDLVAMMYRSVPLLPPLIDTDEE
jgi:hypothetical protein